jgi:hypothetical protein
VSTEVKMERYLNIGINNVFVLNHSFYAIMTELKCSTPEAITE